MQKTPARCPALPEARTVVKSEDRSVPNPLARRAKLPQPDHLRIVAAVLHAPAVGMSIC